MKVNDKILSIPPYLSTSWRSVMSIRLDQDLLIVTLKNGDSISVPGLRGPDLDKIFKGYEAYLENETEPAVIVPRGSSLGHLLSDLGLSEGPAQMSLGIFQHDPALSGSLPLPAEILHKIVTVAKMMAAENNLVLPKPEPNCQCFHCQVARAVQEAVQPQEEIAIELDAEVTEDELQFSQWAIRPAGENLYKVLNKLDTTEEYAVFLGEPVGCTCGKSGCEHVLAVLRS